MADKFNYGKFTFFKGRIDFKVSRKVCGVAEFSETNDPMTYQTLRSARLKKKKWKIGEEQNEGHDWMVVLPYG